MRTQWVVGSGDSDWGELGIRSAYRPRHARSGRHHQPRHVDADERMPSWRQATGIAEPFTITACESYGYSTVSIGQVLRGRAAAFVREHSRRYSDEQWSHQGTG
jgi:hypothetical protein